MAALFGAFFGLSFVFLVPPASTFDGPSHYFRALQVSEGRMRAEQYSPYAIGGQLPLGQVAFVDALWNSYWVSHDFGSLAQWAAFSRECEPKGRTTRAEFTNTAVYSPLNYGFQAAGLWLSRRFTASPLSASRTGCLLNLVGYLVLVVAAIERLPRFRRGFLLVAASPLLLVQAASFSADGINFALPALLLAWTWRLRASGPPGGWLKIAPPLALGLGVVLLKPTAPSCLVCLCFVPAGYFGSSGAKLSTLAAYYACAAALWLAWNRLYFDVDVSRWYDPSHPSVALQKAYFLAHPFVFLGALAKFIPTGFFSQWPYFYGDVGGWITPRTFIALRWLSILLLPGLLASGCWPGRSDRVWAFGVFVQSAALLSLTSLTLWLADGRPGMDYIPGLAGRYVSLVYLGVALVCSELAHAGARRVRGALFWLAVLGNAGGLTLILLSIGPRVW